MAHWKYKFFEVGMNMEDAERQADALGADGWEAVSAFPIINRGQTYKIRLLMKREKEIIDEGF